MFLNDMAYPVMVYFHLILFTIWLGGDIGVFLAGQHFRKRTVYSLDQRLALLRLLVLIDMFPRSAWALMVPSSLTLLVLGGFWALPLAALAGAWIVGLAWLWLVWDAHRHDMTPRAALDRRIEAWLRYALAAGSLVLGAVSLVGGAPLAPTWLAVKALLFGLIFVAAILIDVCFKPVGPQLALLIEQGSSDATEVPLRRTMDRTRLWVLVVYALLFAISFVGAVKPF